MSNPHNPHSYPLINTLDRIIRNCDHCGYDMQCSVCIHNVELIKTMIQNEDIPETDSVEIIYSDTGSSYRVCFSCMADEKKIVHIKNNFKYCPECGKRLSLKSKEKRNDFKGQN